jgi:hypothetical protein
LQDGRRNDFEPDPGTVATARMSNHRNPPP